MEKSKNLSKKPEKLDKALSMCIESEGSKIIIKSNLDALVEQN